MKPLHQWILYRWYKGEVILLDYRQRDDQTATESFRFARISEAQAFAMGYRRAIGFCDELKYSPFKKFVRFYDSPGYQPIHPKDKETSATLYEYYRSKADERFIEGVTTNKKLRPDEMKKLAIIAVVGAVAAIGVAFIMLK